jgi:DNA invertase Pin-like site-specific DNA recombinase
MNFGYARVSTQDQNLDLQKDALTKAGCETIYEERASGSKAERPELQEMLKRLQRGNTLVIWKLDRLGRNLKHLIELVEQLEQMGVGLISLQENIDTTTANGKLIFHIFCSLAEFEREMIRERTNAGLAAARARGRVGGRKKALKEEDVKALRALSQDKTLSISQICSRLGISKATYYNYLKQQAK